MTRSRNPTLCSISFSSFRDEEKLKLKVHDTTIRKVEETLFQNIFILQNNLTYRYEFGRRLLKNRVVVPNCLDIGLELSDKSWVRPSVWTSFFYLKKEHNDMLIKCDYGLLYRL